MVFQLLSIFVVVVAVLISRRFFCSVRQASQNIAAFYPCLLSLLSFGQASMRELTPVFLNLVSDSSKIVRTVALENLGRLISTLPGESVSEELVRYFTGTAVESMGDPSVSEPFHSPLPAIRPSRRPPLAPELKSCFLPSTGNANTVR